MNPEAVGVILAVVVQTLMLGVWGGRVHQMLKDHERRLNEGHETFATHDKRLLNLEQRVPRSGEDRRTSEA